MWCMTACRGCAGYRPDGRRRDEAAGPVVGSRFRRISLGAVVERVSVAGPTHTGLANIACGLAQPALGVEVSGSMLAPEVSADVDTCALAHLADMAPRLPPPRIRWSEPLEAGVLLDFHRRSSRREPMIPLIRTRPGRHGRRYAMGWWYLDWLPSYAVRTPDSFGTPGNQQARPWLNATGMVEELGLEAVYRVEPSWPMTPIDLGHGVFAADMVLAGHGHYVEGRHLFTMEEYGDAIDFGRRRYGACNFDVFRIAVHDLPVVRYRRHVALCQGLDSPDSARHWPDPAARRGDAYLDIGRLTRAHIRQIVAGGLPAARAST